MQDKILEYHPTLGAITYKGLITDLEIILEDIKNLEDRTYQVLKHTELSNEDISTFYADNIPSRLEWIIFVLKELL